VAIGVISRAAAVSRKPLKHRRGGWPSYGINGISNRRSYQISTHAARTAGIASRTAGILAAWPRWHGSGSNAISGSITSWQRHGAAALASAQRWQSGVSAQSIVEAGIKHQRGKAVAWRRYRGGKTAALFMASPRAAGSAAPRKQQQRA
jgi:hypothetical protein